MPLLRRRRRTFLLVSVCASLLAVAAGAPAAVAEWQPGDTPVNGLDFTGSGSVQDARAATSISCTPLADGRARVEFSFAGPSSDHTGPYAGPAEMSGSLVTSNANGQGTGSELQGRFSIMSPSAVSGTFSGGDRLEVFAACDRSSPYVSFQVNQARYSVQVTGPSRTWTDMGHMYLRGSRSCWEPDSCGGADEVYFRGGLSSSDSAPAHFGIGPSSGTIRIGTTDTIAASVLGISVAGSPGAPKAGVTVHFGQQVGEDGDVAAIGSCVTNASGECRLSYEGPSEPASTLLVAWLDLDLSGTQGRGEGAVTATRTWTESGVGDADGDGIEDPVDAGSDQGSFRDTSTTPHTTGAIYFHAGLGVRVADAPGTDGVRIRVGAGHPDAMPAVVETCGFELSLKQATDVVATCGSVLLRVLSGQVTVRLQDGATTVTVPAGVTAKVGNAGADGRHPVENLGGGSLTVTAGGTSTTVSAGSSWGVVSWRWEGFFAPVDNNGVLNTLKAGQAVPLKWRLRKADGTPVLGLTSVKVTSEGLSCEGGRTSDALEEVGTGASGLRELGDGLYQFNWATPKSYANSCRRVRLDVGDGTPHEALFRFTR